MGLLSKSLHRRPGRTFVDAFPEIRKTVARALHARGTSCACGSPLHWSAVDLPDPRADEDWGYDHLPWLSLLDRPVRHRDCAYCRLLRRCRARGHRDLLAGVRGRDLPQKRALHTALARGTCDGCGRDRDPDFPGVGFDLNHKVCKRAGGEKDRPLSYWWLDWSVVCGPMSPAQSALNREALDTPFEEAAPRMRHEATLCDLQCRSCHQQITDDQGGGTYDWDLLEAWLSERIVRGVVRALCGSRRRVVLDIDISGP